MSSLRRRTVAVTTLALLIAGLTAPTSARATSPHALIVGSGSSWASTTVNQWIADVHGRGLQVVYDAVGSAAGRQDFAAQRNDFAVSDLPYQGTDPATGNEDTSQGRSYTTVPLVGGGLSFPYHLVIGGQVLRTLRLSGASIAGIFTGAIRYWDDPQIEADNRGRIALPHLAVLPVVHAEGSATSFRLSHYLSTQYPQVWGSLGAPSPYYPQTADAVPQNGSDAVANYVASGAGNGSIGYDEYSYALAKNYPVAAVQNGAGDFVLPTSGNVSVALRSASAQNFDTGDLGAVYASTDPRAYPLSSWSSALIPTGAADAKENTAKRNTLAAYLAYGLCTGQASAAPLGDAPLPLNLVKAGFDGLAALAQADPDVDATGLDVEHCTGNPTFTAGSPPQDTLDDTAPYPPACAGPTQGPCGIPADTTSLTTPATATVAAGRAVLESTHLSDVTTARPLAGATVTLWQRAAGASAWHPLSSGPTTAGGARSVGVRPSVTSTYQYRYAGDADHAAVASNATVVRVVPVVTLRSTAASPRHGAGVELWGFVTPGRSGRVDTLQVYLHGRWAAFGHVVEGYQHDPDGRPRMSFTTVRRFSPAGSYRLRVVTPAAVDLQAGISPVLTLTVR